jgi:urease accessory protein
MVIIEAVLGNLKDRAWQARAAKAEQDGLVLNQWDAQKNRFRKCTEQGMEIAVSLERNVFLRDGDILSFDETTGKMVIARISMSDVMVIHLEALARKDPATLVRTCVELGHALGNQHWPAVAKGDQVYVPLTVDRKVMASVMNTHAFLDVTCEFQPASVVVPYLSPHESRRLFGGAEQESHAHPGIPDGSHGPSTGPHRHGQHDHPGTQFHAHHR